MNFRPIFDVALSYLIYSTIIGIAVLYRPALPFLLILAFLLALTLHRLGTFIHAAVHGDFDKMNRQRNDAVYRWTLGWFFGTDLERLRKVHFAHHRLHGTDQPDPEDTYSRGLNLKSITELVLRKDPASLAAKQQPATATHSSHLIYIAYLVQLAVLGLCSYRLGIVGALFYGLPVFLGLPIITHVRNCLEHSSNGEPVTRNFKRGFWAFFLGPAGFRLHLEHHRFPAVAYWQLDSSVPQVSYLSTLLQVMGTPMVTPERPERQD